MFKRLLKRAFGTTGRGSDVWPVVLVLLAVLVPAVCLLWFMAAAMRNERYAARQKLADAYRAQLSASRMRLAQSWRETTAALEKCAATSAAPRAFARCVQSGLVDSAVILDEQGRPLYPHAPVAASGDFGELESRWQEASRLEDRHKHVEAADRFHALARESTNEHAAARAFQAEARTRLQAGQTDAVIRLVTQVFGRGQYERATDLHGRAIAANAELMALELITNRNSALFESIAGRLAARLADYDNPALASPQRRFLMKEVRRLAPQQAEFSTLEAEELAADVSENHLARGLVLQRSGSPDLWQFTTPDHRVLALLRSERLRAALRNTVAPDSLPADVKVVLVPPDADAADAFVTLPAGEQMPGWRLALSLHDRKFFDATAEHQAAVYLWAGLLAVSGIGVLTVLAVRLVRRQMTLARMKNDLAATVSHELKTPLSSMRVLVESLLDSERLDEQKTREYLDLIARENERLSRLIQNFLTFSRMERNKYALQFSLLDARPIVEAAVAAVRGRLDAPGCRLDVRVDEDLPPLRADPDALATALINLLENACKYSQEIKHIVLRARAENGRVIFSVTDNGIGIAPRDQRKIFRPFQQADQRLSRNGSGCGLGLSIVQFIAAAHHGTISVESKPGFGSTFAISLPAAPDVTVTGKEAAA